MKKAFTTCFPLLSVTSTSSGTSTSVDCNDGDLVENADCWSELHPDDEDFVDEALNTSSSRGRAQCFAHTLQLVINDALKETKYIFYEFFSRDQFWQNCSVSIQAIL
jgi:hypothetical protein